MKRTAVTLMLPEHLAKALLEASSAAGRIDRHGRIVMDHFIIAKPQAAIMQEEGAHARQHVKDD